MVVDRWCLMVGGSLREVVTRGFVLISPGNMKSALQC